MEQRIRRWFITVDGDRFDVRENGPGSYDFTWLTGPNPGYGFGILVHGGVSLSVSELEQEAREFLALVDAETGYIE
ncbi:hypothetical protein [Streptomyces sp. NPDC093568]|uniref:hypothetical protein n=1 Tax=Streptomyces sp. NPDC093568 TaxID=3366041 RepID=UPI003815B891